MKSTANQRKEHVGDNSVAIFIRLAVVAKSAKSREILRKFELRAVQGHPMSLILVSIESAYVINNNYGVDVSLTVFEILTRLARNQLVFSIVRECAFYEF